MHLNNIQLHKQMLLNLLHKKLHLLNIRHN